MPGPAESAVLTLTALSMVMLLIFLVRTAVIE